MRRKILTCLTATIAFLFSASFALASPVSWDGDFVNQILQPLSTYSGAAIKGHHFVATSTIPSVFPYASTTAVSASSLCLLTDCRTVWPSNTNYFTNNGNSTYLSTGTNLGVGTTTPSGRLAVDDAPGDLTPYLLFSSGSTTAGTTTNVSITPESTEFRYLDTGPTINSGFKVNYNAAPVATVPHGDDIQINGSDNNHAALYIDSHGGLWSTINLRTANGTGASPSATTIGEELGRVAGRGYGTSDWTGSTAAVSFRAAENFSSTAQGTYTVLSTTALGTTGGGNFLFPVERVRIQPSGGVSIGSAAFNATDPGIGVLALLTGLQTPYASTTNITLSGQLYDSLNSPGANGYVLQTTGAGTQWVSTTTLGFSGGGGSGTVNSGLTGQFPYYASNGTALTATSSIFLASSGNIGVGTTTPQYPLTAGGQTFLSDLTGIGLAPVAANSLVVGTTTATGSWIGASITNSGASTNSAAVMQGLNVTAAWGPNSTVNSTATTLGGGVRNRYQARNNSIGLNIADASAVTGQCIVNGTAASTTDCATYNAENPAISAGNLLTNSYGLWVRGLSVAGTITNHYGVYVESLVSGTNRYGFYQAGATDPNYFAGNTGIGSTTPGSLFSIGGNTTGTNFFDNATTTKSGTGGYSISSGCYQMPNGTCLTSGGTNYFTLTGNNLQNNVGTGLGINVAPNFANLEVQASTTGARPLAIWTAAALPIITALDSGNVGIGTTTPVSTFSIAGSGTTNPFIVSSSTGAAMLTLTNAGVLTNAGTLTSAGIRSTAAISSGSNAAAFLALPPAANDLFLGAPAINATGRNLAFVTSSNLVQAAVSAQSGKWVIGTTTTPAVFHIQAPPTSANVSGFGSLADLFDISTTTSATYATSSLFVVGANGNVGIGSSTPFAKLTVVGDLSITGGGIYDNNYNRGTNGQILQTTGSGIQWIGTSTLNIAISDTVGTLAIARGGTGITAIGASSTMAISDGTNFKWQTLFFNGISGFLNLATQVVGVLAQGNGGTGFSTYTTGDILYASASNVLSKLGIGSTGQVLTVAGGVPTWAPVPSTASSTVDYFIASTTPTSTWTKPAGLKYVVIEVIGGGGSGGNEAFTTAASAGGGAGGYCKRTLPAASLGSTETVTVGAGGAAQASSGATGNTGNTSSFGSWCSSTGGTGGGGSTSSNNRAGGSGGTGSGGDLNVPGNAGEGGSGTAAASAVPGIGGGSFFGGGAGGNAGNGSNGGGGSGIGAGSTGAGGAGGTGMVIINDYY